MSTFLVHKLIGKNWRHWTQKICPLVTDSCLLCSLSVLFAEIMLCESWNQYRKMHRAGHTADSHSRTVWFKPHSNPVPSICIWEKCRRAFYPVREHASWVLSVGPFGSASIEQNLKVTDLNYADVKQFLSISLPLLSEFSNMGQSQLYLG